VFQRGPAGVSSIVISCCAHAAALGAIVSAFAAPPPVPFILDPPCPEFIPVMTVPAWPLPPTPVAPVVTPAERSIDGTLDLNEPIVDATPLTGEPVRGVIPELVVGVEGGVTCGCSAGSTGIVGGLAATLPPPPAPFAGVALPSKPLRVGGVTAPAKLVDVKPRYPALARQAHIEGVVILDLTIDESGRVENVEILRSVKVFDAAAVDAVRRWRFEPALLNGRPTPIVMTVTVSFVL